MATLKQIRQRIRSAKNIQQITRAMKLVAAARLTRAKMRVEEARPYAEKMREFMENVGQAGELPAHPLLDRREIKTIGLLLLTADRGLAGSYNTLVIRKAADFLKESGKEHSIIGVGKKGWQFFSKRGHEVAKSFTLPTAGGDISHAVEIADEVKRMFVEGEVDAIYLCYSKFYSPIRQVPQVVQLLPIEPPVGSHEEEIGSKVAEYMYEPEPAALLGLLLPKYLVTVVYQALLEAAASEHGARMTAMTSATDNAGKMIGGLTLTANRVRQAGITKEILEIVGGAEALKA